jgi:hypothetical protein
MHMKPTATSNKLQLTILVLSLSLLPRATSAAMQMAIGADGPPYVRMAHGSEGTQIAQGILIVPGDDSDPAQAELDGQLGAAEDAVRDEEGGVQVEGTVHRHRREHQEQLEQPGERQGELEEGDERQENLELPDGPGVKY